MTNHDRSANWLQKLAGLLHKPWWAFPLGFSIIYWTGVWAAIPRKLLWFDELLSLHGARLPDLSRIWDATIDGTLAEPPLFTSLAHLTRNAFGNDFFAVRLPAAAGVWVLLLALFFFVRRPLGGGCSERGGE